jgi:hypothetical protein
VNRPLPWERLLWRGRPARLRPWLTDERYYLTDFRLVRDSRCCPDEIPLQDVGEVARTESRLDRVLGTSTLIIHSRRDDRPPFVVADIRRGEQLAAALELLSSDQPGAADAEAVRAALAWVPRHSGIVREAAGAIVAVLVAIAAVVTGVRGRPIPITYADDDLVRPHGVKRPAREIAAFMEREVMPWARRALGPIVGGENRVTCETCHGAGAEMRDWQMPSVAALPEPLVRERGFEIYSAGMDAQMRNAIYGYSAEPDKSAKAAYMREVVLPGMARLLHRPTYDFTRTYEHNLANNALGCYHCHKVK